MMENHFFAASVGAWATTSDERDLRQLLAMFEAEGLAYDLWLVPLPPDAEYRIKAFAPQVEGAVWCGVFTPKRGSNR